jgi:predicted PurR-regulated permease PerM
MDITTPAPPPVRGQAAAIIALAAVIIAGAVWTLHGYIPALAWATIFAIALWPLYTRLQAARGKHGDLLALGVTLAVALVFVVPVLLVGLRAQREAGHVLELYRDAIANGIPVPDALAHLPLAGPRIAEWWQANLADPEGADQLTRLVDRDRLMHLGREAGASLAHGVLLFAFMLLALFFLFRDGADLTQQLRRAAHRAFGARGELVGTQMIGAVHGTVNGLVLVGLGVGVLACAGYVIGGVPHPALFGILTAVAAMLPLCAPIAIAAAALTLVLQGKLIAAGAVFAWSMVVNSIADHAIRPALIGGATKLPFLLVLLGILGGVETWGLLGLFLGPALMAAMVALWRDYVAGCPVEAAQTETGEPLLVRPR